MVAISSSMSQCFLITKIQVTSRSHCIIKNFYCTTKVQKQTTVSYAFREPPRPSNLTIFHSNSCCPEIHPRNVQIEAFFLAVFTVDKLSLILSLLLAFAPAPSRVIIDIDIGDDVFILFMHIEHHFHRGYHTAWGVIR